MHNPTTSNKRETMRYKAVGGKPVSYSQLARFKLGEGWHDDRLRGSYMMVECPQYLHALTFNYEKLTVAEPVIPRTLR